MRVVVNYPSFLLGEDCGVYSFHAYNYAFTVKYADAIYVQNEERAKLILDKMRELRPDKEVAWIKSVEELNPDEDVVIGFRIGMSGTAGLENFNGIKIFHTLDYYLNTTKQYEVLKELKATHVVAHSQVDECTEFFGRYYPEYVGKVISLPFGYSRRFVNNRTFEDRKNKAVGLGSINKVKDAMCSEEESRECVEFFKGRVYTHETRKYVQDHAEKYADCIDALFPTPEKQKDFSYDAVEMLNSYKMYINDAGMSNFPPARTYEGIACGCVMVAEDSSIYRDLGFIPDVNYIGFTPGNYQEMADKIRYYINHEEDLKAIQEQSLLLAQNYTHEKVADGFYNKVKAIWEGRR